MPLLLPLQVRWVTDATRPISVLGDMAAWQNIDAAVDFLVWQSGRRRGEGLLVRPPLPPPPLQIVNAGGSAVVGVRASGDIDLLPGVWLSLAAGPGGVWNVSGAVQARTMLEGERHHLLAIALPPECDTYRPSPSQNISSTAVPPVATGPLPGGGILPGTWHRLRALANGSAVSFFLDGVLLVALNTSATSPPAFPAAGWLGLGSVQWADTTWFDNVTVAGLPDTCALGRAPAHTNATLQVRVKGAPVQCSGLGRPAGMLACRACGRAAPAPPSPPLLAPPLLLQTCDASNANARLTWAPTGGGGGAGQLGLLSSAGALCLGTWGVYPHTGALSVATLPCNASDATQVWTLQPNASDAAAAAHAGAAAAGTPSPTRIVNAATDQCLEFPGQQAATGTRVETWACHQGPNPPDGNQLWFFDPPPPGTGNGSALQSVLAGLCVALCQ